MRRPYTDTIRGNSGFDAWFQKQGIKDAQGRSLRDFDLHTRLFRYPLSYLVYTPAFNALPDYARDYVFGRFAAVLQGRDTSQPYAFMTATERRDTLQILTATAAGLRAIPGKASGQRTVIRRWPGACAGRPPGAARGVSNRRGDGPPACRTSSMSPPSGAICPAGSGFPDAGVAGFAGELPRAHPSGVDCRCAPPPRSWLRFRTARCASFSPPISGHCRSSVRASGAASAADHRPADRLLRAAAARRTHATCQGLIRRCTHRPRTC